MTKAISLSLNSQLAQDLSKAVVDAIGKTFGLTVRPGAYSVNEGAAALNGDVSGIVGVVQDTLEGTLTICFKIETVRSMLPALLGDGVEVTNDVAMDAVGEITNMVFGQLKTELNQRGHQVRFGFPSVVKGSGHFVAHMHQGAHMVIPFDVAGSNFQLHFAIHSEAARL